MWDTTLNILQKGYEARSQACELDGNIPININSVWIRAQINVVTEISLWELAARCVKNRTKLQGRRKEMYLTICKVFCQCFDASVFQSFYSEGKIQFDFYGAFLIITLFNMS